MTHEVSILNRLVRISLEEARRRVSHFARLAAMVRYYKVDGYTDEDRDMVLEAIQRLAEQYECDAREQRDVLLAAYEARHFGYDDGSPVRH